MTYEANVDFLAGWLPASWFLGFLAFRLPGLWACRPASWFLGFPQFRPGTIEIALTEML